MSSLSGASGLIRLAPSDLTFLWEDCRRCFWLKARGVLKRPSAPFPKIFTKLDQQTKDYFLSRRTEEMSASLRPGRVAFGDRWVRSDPLDIPGHDTKAVLSGRIDTALAFDEGPFGVIDFKTAEPRPEHVPFYSRQLHSYALALENAASGTLKLAPVTQLGLLCVEPVTMIGLKDAVAYQATIHFLEIERDDAAFLTFLSQVLFLLERPEPPEASSTCPYCAYIAAGSLMLLTSFYG